ncbi:bifunctional 4-hydroxy-2-oxoglutarate aldolase/2-dehydro-3-deoxy-phosphogluconate aldolase [Microbaculum sp. FT89]|uniref:bifunctional 4-hydroxy-2-oxoglutarate aldolase/2-dehydro-3-deoxy-phosphogluconate aldolase n=1 Tax=Microbaculum sp. FT89 TaxID=3447298 RepID=UPI003F529B96
MVDRFIDRLRAARVVPVIRHDDPGIAEQACGLLAAEGVSILEITMTVPGAIALIATLRDRFPSACIGAGTVLSAHDADAAIGAGAAFLVSPCWSDAAARSALEGGIPYLPGAMTPGEILHHAEAGATVVKVFPADAAGGPGFLKAVRAVFPHIPLMPTGGVSPETAQAYLDAGAICVGIGGNLLPAKALEAGRIDEAREQIRAALSAIQLFQA